MKHYSSMKQNINGLPQAKQGRTNIVSLEKKSNDHGLATVEAFSYVPINLSSSGSKMEPIKEVLNYRQYFLYSYHLKEIFCSWLVAWNFDKAVSN